MRAALRAGPPFAKPKPDDPAVVLFTSGSEGAPEGVAHYARNAPALGLCSLCYVIVGAEPVKAELRRSSSSTKSRCCTGKINCVALMKALRGGMGA